MKVRNLEDIQSEISFDMLIKPLAEKSDFEGSISVEHVTLTKNTHYPPHYHASSNAFIFFLSGSGNVVDAQGNTYEYKQGDMVYFKAKVEHGFVTHEETKFITVQYPPILNQKSGEEDFYFR